MRRLHRGERFADRMSESSPRIASTGTLFNASNRCQNGGTPDSGLSAFTASMSFGS